MNGSRILLVEDDEDIGGELIQALTGHGYRARLACGGTEALSAAVAEPPDLVLLDLGLPDIDGVVLCRRLRAAVPDGIIVVLTARTGEFEVVVALDAGADDYLAKPFRLTELMARLRAHLRRRPGPDERTCIEVGRLRLDLLARRAWLGPEELALRPKEFDLLAVLTASAGQVLTRNELMAGVWDENWFGSTKTLDVHVAPFARIPVPPLRRQSGPPRPDGVPAAAPAAPAGRVGVSVQGRPHGGRLAGRAAADARMDDAPAGPRPAARRTDPAAAGSARARRPRGQACQRAALTRGDQNILCPPGHMSARTSAAHGRSISRSPPWTRPDAHEGRSSCMR